jgi:hypothetical protein
LDCYEMSHIQEVLTDIIMVNFEILKWRIITIDGTCYSSTIGYDTCSRVKEIFFPSTFGIKYSNSIGYLSEVRRKNNHSLI